MTQQAVFVQPDQLSRASSLFEHVSPGKTRVIMAESLDDLSIVPFHKQRLTLVLSAMRHFAAELQQDGWEVSYAHLGQSVEDILAGCPEPIRKVRLMESADWGAAQKWASRFREMGVDIEFVENDLFLSTRLGREFQLQPAKSVRMESFYRRMRKATGILMELGQPVGGQWNYDKDNRLPARSDLEFPGRVSFEVDSVTEMVMRDVDRYFPDHFGEIGVFDWPVTRDQAHQLFEDFLDLRLPSFGPYQDAMVLGEDTLFHSLISGCLNLGLLEPEDLCRRAEARYHSGDAPLNSVEGFVRQVLGWREFVYQLYRANMPGYDDQNFLGADLPLPEFYWNGETDMVCVAEAIRPVLEKGLNHHIQRLMITGNFGLIAGVDPHALNRWYWLAYIDAWHWVVTPNVIGMATFADGGIMASKPYAASANYVNRMSNYCAGCHYDPRQSVGEKACPLNALYWDFLARNEDLLGRNPRMTLSYRNLRRKSGSERQALQDQAGTIRQKLRRGERL